MSYISRLTPWFSSLFIFSILFKIITKPKTFYWLSPILFLIIFIAIFLLTDVGLKNKKYWHFLISPVIFLAGILSFIVFIELRWLKIGLIAIFTIILGLFLQNLYLYNFKPEKYQTYGLQNFSSYLNLISIFLVFSSFFGFIIFLQIPLWPLLLGVIVVSFLSIYQLMWVSEINLNRSWLYLFIITLVLAEGFWVLAFLPTSIYVNGLVLASVYYITVGLSLNKLLGILEKSVIKRYITIIAIVLIITLISAKWI